MVFMDYNDGNFFPIQRKNPEDITPEEELLFGSISDVFSRLLQYASVKLRDAFIEWVENARKWLKEHSWHW